ncbi:MAG TPA: KamA family radical SAM protein [Bacteroidales bacterium]|nr:KamA family radical SAM protein [Bacteroidales bacterium]
MKPAKKNVWNSASDEAEVQEPPLPHSGTAEAEVKLHNHPAPGQVRQAFIRRHFPGTSQDDWNNWQWQLRNSFKSIKDLSTFLNLSQDELAVTEKNINLPVRVTPYYASLLSRFNPDHPLRKTVVPVMDELILSDGESADPLGETHDSVARCLVHRYPDRVLFLVSDFCGAYCRYCTRSHMVAKEKGTVVRKQDWNLAIDYIRNHSEVRDVILSGGDPLTLSDNLLEYLLSGLRSIPHLEIIRIGTKVPAVLPQRITPSLVNMLRKYHPIFMSLHFTHPDEMTPETQRACNMLADAGIPLGSQTVLLKGINDNTETFKKLFHQLLKVRVKPYYIYQCDPIPGSRHFRTPVQKGLEIIRGLRGFTSGYAIPHYVIDAPGGGGKIPILPEYVIGHNEKGLLLRNFEGKEYVYPDHGEGTAGFSHGVRNHDAY